MRQGPNSRRARGRSSSPNRRPNLPNRNQTFDSNGPEVRIRGNAYQVHERYLTLARDASAAGDRIMSENYLQHAEHYYRIINAINEAYNQAERPQYEQPRESATREGGQRDNGQREGGQHDGGQREGAARDAASRDNGQREGGQREGGQRDGGQRDNGQREGGQRERSHRDLDPRDLPPPELEFGEDPRQTDDAESDLEGDSSPITELAPVGAPAGEGDDQEGARPTRPRRRMPRQRRTTGNGSAEGTDVSVGEADGE